MARRPPKPAAAPAADASTNTPEPAADAAAAEQAAAGDAGTAGPVGDDPVTPSSPAARPLTDPVTPDGGTTAEPDAGKRTSGPNPFAIRSDAEAGVRLLEDRRFRQMQLQFVERPSDAVRQAVRDAGFQWRAADRVWSKAIVPDQGWRTRAAAEALFHRVVAEIRAERGLGRRPAGEGVPF